MSEKNKVLLFYPPGKIYQRGEDRCQQAVDGSSAEAMRACNDLGYAAALSVVLLVLAIVGAFLTNKANTKEG